MAKIDTILCIGAAHWDIIGRVSADREDPGGDYPGTVVRRPGGVALNSAVALCAAGLSVSLCAAIGRDDAGRSLVKRLAASGIGCDGLLRPDGSTDSYIAIETSAGSLLGAVADCRLLEACGVALAQRAIDLIRTHAPGRLVVDGNLPETAMRDLMAGTEEPVSILAASPAKAHRLSRLPARHRVSLYATRTEAEFMLGGDSLPDAVAAARALRTAGFASAMVTDGAATAACAGPGFVELALPPAVTVTRITGAGDAFAAGHLSALAKGAGQADALRFALDAAARHVSTDAA